MSQILKLIGVTLIVWFAFFTLVMGALTTGLVVTGVLFIFGLISLFGGTWLTVHLLQRDAHFDLQKPLIWLIVSGGAVVVVAIMLVRGRI